MIRKLPLVVALTGMWVALWTDVAAGTVVGGLLAAAAVAAFVRSQASDRALVLRPLAALRYAVTFAWLLLAATAAVARQVLGPGAGDTHGVVVEVALAERAYPVRTIIAHSISLTPGTLTVDVGDDGRTLYVHVMNAAQRSAALEGIAALEQRACEAFAPALDQAGAA